MPVFFCVEQEEAALSRITVKRRRVIWWYVFFIEIAIVVEYGFIAILVEYIFNAFMTNYIAIAIVVDGNVRITVTVFVLSLQESDEFVFQTIRDVYIA